MKRKILGGLVATAAMFGAGATAVSAAPPADKPDTACMQAGIGVLQGAGLLPAVAADGLPIATAVSVGVTVRDGADLSGVPDPIPIKVVLADHRAGDNSLFVYPWCS
ncbi:MAG: hypothetical protein OER95_16440 [Acidimicrobiia bacterium]|nr:hypothetical protein [Acidimicrobiia bacterium]